MHDYRSQHRKLGIFYTPAHAAELMAELSLSHFESDDLTILDPACGEGALLAAVLSQRMRSHPHEDTNALIRRRVFGIDVDPGSVAQTRRRLFEMIAPSQTKAGELRRLLDAQIICGDALTGGDFCDATPLTTDGLHWQHAFPQIAERGGFDLVIANPPYRRERHSKAIFDRIAASTLGKRWRSLRMDLWHYFLHRSLDVTKPNGRLSFLVNSYWTKSPGARKLIDRLQHETTLEEIVEFDSLPLFDGVAGRHMILQLQKGSKNRPCRVTRVTTSDDRFSERDVSWLNSSDMFRDGQLILQSHVPLEHAASTRLGDRFVVRQGIAENPPAINARIAREFPGEYTVGDGVFVLTADEIDRLDLSDAECEVLRPYAQACELRRYRLSDRVQKMLLYLTRRTAPDLSQLPRIARHLQRFRPLLERRREVLMGTIGWWHLHWPRVEKLFMQPRILHVQMGRRPAFVYAEQPLFAGFSVNVIAQGDDGDLSLPALTAILNSSSAAEWFDAFAKRRGVNLEISGTVLRRFPLPEINEPTANRLNDLSIQRHAVEGDHAEIEREIDAIVADAYGTSHF